MGSVRSLTLLPLLCYPFIAHVGVVKAVYWPLVACCALWLALLTRQLHLKPFARLLLLISGLVVVVVAGRYPALGEQLLPLPSLIIFLVLAGGFGLSLRPGSRPLVTRIAAALGDPLDADLLGYTRLVTLAWCALFMLLAVVSLVLWMLAPREHWSLFTNFLAYGLLLLMFVAEYLYRQRRFAFAREQRFLDFLRALTRIQPSDLWR